MKKSSLFFTFIVILTPILIITTGMRIALSPIFYHLEYRLPNFPPDTYGFTLSDRLKWADFSIDFISGKMDDETFTEQELPDGSALFNDREIAHMIDVRDLAVVTLWVWRSLLSIFAVTTLFNPGRNQENQFLKALGLGAKITISIIAGVLLFLMINFNQLFTAFHRIFFEGDSWLFFYTDTLIRLFPLKFWQDLFIFIGVFSLIASIVLILLEIKSSVRE